MKGLSYHCRCCDSRWHVDEGEFSYDCPICGSRSDIHNIPNEIYDEWEQMDRDAETYKKLKEDRIWNYCLKTWGVRDAD